MKTLPQTIADGLVWLGIAPPVNSAVAEASPMVFSVDKKLEEKIMSSVRNGDDYDPDAEFIGAGQPTYTPFDFKSATDPDGKHYDVVASLYEASVDGLSYRLTKIEGREALIEAIESGGRRWEQLGMKLDPTRLREAVREDRTALLEARAQLLHARLREDSDWSDQNGANNGGGSQSQAWDMNDRYGSGIDANAEYIPLMGGPYAKQLYQYPYLDMHRKAFEAYNHNPIAHQLVELQTAFVLGRGLDHQCTNNDVDETWREFIDRTDFYLDLENIASDMWWQGEMMMEYYDNKPSRGMTDYRMVDPSTVLDFCHEPDDIQTVYFYHQQYSTPMMQYTDSKVPSVKYIIRQIPASDLFHLKLNVSKYEKRGRSDLFSVLGWLKRLKDLMNARVIKGQLEASFVYDIEVNGGDAAVAQANMQLPDPFKAGSIWVHNKNATMRAVTSGIKANEAQPDVSALLNMIAVGFGIPKEFIGEAGKGARAGALAATEPGTKRFEKRQRLIEFMCLNVCDRVIANAIKAGSLDIDKALADARSVKRLTNTGDDVPARSDVSDEMQTKNEQFAKEQQQQQQDQLQTQNKLALTQGKQQHELAINDQKNQHRQALASIKNTATTHKITTTNNNVKEAEMRESLRMGELAMANIERTMALVDVRVDSAALVTHLIESYSKASHEVLHLAETLRGMGVRESTGGSTLNAAQKKRIAAIKKSGKYAKEFFEFVFPSIAQEDRSAKLKDLALAEAMQWLPKSITAKMAAKEFNITAYDFMDTWAQIVEEAELGLSMAHVYAQDNQHSPATTIAQDVQAEEAAKQPIAPANVMTNVPTPPAVAGDKLMPAAPGGSAGGATAPAQPNSGATKVNKHSGPEANDTDPTAKPSGYSAAGNHPMTGEGQARIKKAAKESMELRNEIHQQLMREVLGPVTVLRTQMAQMLLSDPKAIEELLTPDEE